MDLTRTTFHLHAEDDLRLAAHASGDGTPLVCLPGGPMLDSEYLGDLGGLDASRRLVLLDPRGTGSSERASDTSTYRCDRMVADVEALRRHLGVERLDLLAHSAGANLAYRYAERHPDRLGRLVLVTPSVLALDVEVPDEARSEVSRLRSHEAWYDDAARALATVQAGRATEDDWAALTPLTYARWDERSRAYDARMESRRDPESAAAFAADGAFDPKVTTASLSRLEAPVLVLAGAWDVGSPPSVMAEVASLFPRGRLVVQAASGHFPWHDDPAAFRSLLTAFLDG